jgi:dTDP-4-amino-4,6-dideoxygalactose transaminase
MIEQPLNGGRYARIPPDAPVISAYRILNTGSARIDVTKSYLPPLDEYIERLQGIWESNQLTNNGHLVRELETKLKDFLGVKHLFFVSNGTLALQIAIKALALKGEIITTPFSYVATTSSIVWEGCEPVFVDIDPDTLSMNPDLVEHAMTPRTCAILATHVYGYPCDVVRIREVANRHGLKVIYDAAHAFGAGFNGRSLSNYGDVSTLSFHATKLFHTAEGGALVTCDDRVADRIAYMRNFGHRGPIAFSGLGINGKSSEFHAAMGLCMLPKVPELIDQRRAISQMYDRLLVEGSRLRRPASRAGTRYNYAYYPVLFPSEEDLLAAQAALHDLEIYPRRYFYPSLNTLAYVRHQHMPVSEDIAERVLCLPLYHDLEGEQVRLIAEIIRREIS